MKKILIAMSITLVVGFIFGFYSAYTMKTKSNYNKANEYFVEGQKEFDAKNYREAAEMFNKAIGLNPDLDSAHVMLSNTYQKLGFYDMAKKELEAGGIKTSR